MIIDTMRMNMRYAGECPIIDEESYTDATRFFDLLKDSSKSLYDGCTNNSKLSIITQVFTIKSNHELSEADYDMIFEWAISIVKSMIKPLGLGYKKVNMCLNFCIFYCLENAELTKYRTCEHAHYKLIIGREMTLATYRKLGYFPITHRLQRLFMSPKPIEQ